MKSIILLVCTLIFGSISIFAVGPINISTIKELNFEVNKFASGRRIMPKNQLICIGGTAHRESNKIVAASCINHNNDIGDPIWKCKINPIINIRLGKTSVSCEGFGGPDDPFILAGSCVLYYTLDYITPNFPNPSKEEEMSQTVYHKTDYYTSSLHLIQSLTFGITLGTILLIISIVTNKIVIMTQRLFMIPETN
jgi:hypothetical protein